MTVRLSWRIVSFASDMGPGSRRELQKIVANVKGDIPRGTRTRYQANDHAGRLSQIPMIMAPTARSAHQAAQGHFPDGFGASVPARNEVVARQDHSTADDVK